jgi:phenylacetic acid degradation operon negative regulatory protein
MAEQTLERSAPPLTARSVALSLLLGVGAARLPVRDLIRLGSRFGIAPSAMRAALSRMVAAHDLTASGSGYALTERHLRRQAVQEDRLHPRHKPFDGAWAMAVVVTRGRPAGARSGLRSELAELRFGELREGVWLRPDNLDQASPSGEDLELFTARPEHPAALAGTLWDLDGWARRAEQLLGALGGDGPAIEQFTAAAAAVRLLRTDPALPSALLPARWPAEDLHRAYDDYRAGLSALVRIEPDRTELP